MLFWPSVAALGFLALAALVIALGTSSTARYEFERNRVQGQRQQAAAPAQAAVPVGGPSGTSQSGSDVLRPVPGGGGAATQERALEQATAVSVATHPAGKRVVQAGEASAWWLVDECGDQPGEQIVAGPFPDRIEADWAALSGGLVASQRAVYGVPRPDGGLVRRQSPQEQAWLGELGVQLDRLAEDWDEHLSDEDALVTLVVEVAAALVEAGLPLHDCAGEEPAGGVCMTPEPGHGGVLVSWHQHDRMSRQQVRGPEAAAAVQRTMNAALAEVLAELGFEVVPFGSTGCCFVPAGGI